MSSETRSLQEWLRYAKQRFAEAGVPEPEADARILLEAVFSVGRTQFYLHPERIPLPRQAKRFSDMVEKRCARIPLQYITGKQNFMGFSFDVTPAVLIPRLDTEILAETVLTWIGGRKAEVLDLCTGSGCIAVSIAKLAKNARVTATDISTEALETAKKNSRQNGTDIRFLQGDLFTPFCGGERFDAIISNPPYIPSAELAELEPEVRDWEPALALDGSADGLAFYRRIVREAPAYLKDGGLLAFEIGYEQGKAVSELMRQAGFGGVCVQKDLAGLDRVVTGEK